jgi:hypothetical protein
MTESDLRAVLLLRAVERAAPPGWSVDDGQWAGQEARRQVGEQATAEAWLVQRARLGLVRLGDRGGRLAWLATGVAGWGRWAAALVLAVAALLGAVGDGLGGGQVVNLLAPPLLALLVWNLGVYAVLLGSVLRRLGRRGATAGRNLGARTPSPGALLAGPLRRAVLALGQRCTAVTGRAASHTHPAGLSTAQPGTGSAAADAVALQFGRDWLVASTPLQTARLAALLHAAAALLALGAVVSLYSRGLVLDYRAGWDSTFLSPAAVHRLLATVLGPASALSGLALPDGAGVSGVAGLRLASGGGEGAARWIHLWSLTLGLAVLLPRSLLAALVLLRARGLAAKLPLPADFDDLQALLRSASSQALPVAVLAYSYALDAPRQARLPRLLAAQFGPGAQLRFQALPMGAEDDLPRWLAAVAGTAGATTAGAAPAGAVVVLFALTATPERETHGALLQALAVQLPAATPRVVMLDESGFRARFVGRDGAERLAQRRAAWSALLQDTGQTARFIDLSEAAATPDAEVGGGADPLRRAWP